MDDTQNNQKNQSQGSISPSANTSRPIFESVPIEEVPQNIQPEEVAPDVAAPEDVLTSAPPEFSAELPPVYEEHKGKFVIIGVGVLVFFIILGVVFTLLFRATQTAQKPENITLTYWGLWDDKAIVEPFIAAYEAKNPHIKINYQKMSPQEYREKLTARIPKGQGPDIFRYHNTWIPEIGKVIAPIPESVITKAEFDKTFYPIVAQDLKIGNNYYGIPLGIDGLVLIYNDSMLKGAGIAVPPSEWIDSGDGAGNDMLNAVSKLKVQDTSGNLVTTGFAAGTTSNVEHFGEIYGLLLLLNGGDLKKLNAPEAIEALQIYRKFAEENYWNDSMPNSIAAFIQGKVAMIIAPSWEVLTIKASNPDLSVKVAPVPKGFNGESISLATYWVEGVSKGSKNQIEAWKFLKFLAEKENLTKRYELQTKVRLFGEAYPRVDMADTLASHEFLGPVIQQGNSYKTLPVVSRTFDNGLNDEILQYLRNAINSTAQGTDYSAALSTAKQGIDQVFEKYQIQ
jgi:multiple sugar transport system substrate-binding protein